MSYIKTNDGKILEIAEEHETYYRCGDWFVSKDFLGGNNNVSANIIDLIDYVSFINVYGKFTFKKFKDEEFYKKQGTFNIYKRAFLTNKIKDFKAYTFTGQELIHVANMNEKGELELELL